MIYLGNSGNVLILIREETHPTTVTPNTMTLLAAFGWLAISCIFFKGDWGEMQPTMAFPTFSHNYHSCTICFNPKEALQDYTEFTCAGCPSELKTYAHVDAACRDCEIVVVLTEALHSYIRARLSYDKRDKGVHGRYLCESIPATADHPELLRMDRLEPSAKLTDIGDPNLTS